jgi:prefoldin subunit 5
MESAWSDVYDWSNRRKWYETEDQYVRRQRREGEERTADAEARLQRSVREITEQKDALARQLASLGAAFDALFELMSVREALGRYASASAAREQARTQLAALLAPGSAEHTHHPDLAAVPGYWLPRAMAGLEALVRGSGDAAGVALDDAADCDRQRTALFLALVLPLLGGAEHAVPWLPQALGPAPASLKNEVGAAVREVWRSAARGTYGASGRAAVLRWLAGTDSPESVDQLRALIVRRPSASGSADDVAAQLSRARSAITALIELGRRFSAPSPSDDDGGAPAPALSDRVDPSLILVEALIAEGAPGEAELILRAQQLVAEVRRYRTREETEPEPRWDAPAGTLLTLLEADLEADRESASPDPAGDGAGLQAVAQAALARTAAALAERLLAEASPEPPTSFVMKLDGQTVEIELGQSLDPQLSAVDAAVEERYAPEPGWGLSARKHAAEAAERIAQRKERNRGEAQTALDRFTGLRDQLPELRRTAEQEYSALLTRLGQLSELR